MLDQLLLRLKAIFTTVQARYGTLEKNEKFVVQGCLGLMAVLLVLSILMLLSSDVEESPITPSALEEKKILSRFYLFPSEKLVPKNNQEFIVQPEKTDSLNDGNQFKEDLLKSKLYHREEEIIQSELSKIH